MFWSLSLRARKYIRRREVWQILNILLEVLIHSVLSVLHCSFLEESAFTPQPRAINPEYKRDRDHDDRQTTEQSTGPLYTQVLEHLSGKEREPCCNRRAEHNVGSNC